MQRKRIVLHIDVNSAFLSWSALKLLEEGYPKDIRREIAVVSGDPKTRHGIVVAASIPAKKIGIHTPMNLTDAYGIYPRLIVTESDFQYYRMKSEQMMNYLRSLFEEIEQMSIDECFVEYTSYWRIYGDAVAFAHKLKDEIFEQFGFTVNVGVGYNKLTAKMASDFEKPDKVHVLTPEQFREKVWPMDISQLFMAGKASCEKLRLMGIHTIGELAQSDENYIVQWMKSFGKLLHDYANGIDDSPIENHYDDRKSIGFSRTLEEDSTDREQIYQYLNSFAGKIAKKLKEKSLYSDTLKVTIRNTEFRTTSRQKKYTNTFDSEAEIYRKAKEIFDEFWDGQPIRLIGLGAESLREYSYEQLSLFDL